MERDDDHRSSIKAKNKELNLRPSLSKVTWEVDQIKNMFYYVSNTNTNVNTNTNANANTTDAIAVVVSEEGILRLNGPMPDRWGTALCPSRKCVVQIHLIKLTLQHQPFQQGR